MDLLCMFFLYAGFLLLPVILFLQDSFCFVVCVSGLAVQPFYFFDIGACLRVSLHSLSSFYLFFLMLICLCNVKQRLKVKNSWLLFLRLTMKGGRERNEVYLHWGYTIRLTAVHKQEEQV